MRMQKSILAEKQIKTEKFIIASEQILFKIGKVDKNKIDEYKKSFYNINSESC